MQELFEMIFDCVEYACCYVETDRWKWLKSYFCDFDPVEVKESIPILLDVGETNPLALQNGKILTDEELEEIKMARKINEEAKEVEKIEEDNDIDYNGRPKHRLPLDSPRPISPDSPKSPEQYQELMQIQRNNTYYDNIELETISHPKTTIIFIFLILFVGIMRFRCHKSKNVIFKIITRLNRHANSIFRNFCSILSAK